MDQKSLTFWQAIAEAAGRVVNCETCRLGAPPKYGLPQPGWVGPDYKPGHGIVFILQNPAVSSDDYGDLREMETQRRLEMLAQEPNSERYTEYASQTIHDVVGDGFGKRAWRKWTHPVSKVVDDPRAVAWMNVVKFRTPGQARKDDSVEAQAVRHGLENHLGPELQILRPLVLVTVGNEANAAVDRLPPTWSHRYHLKLQGASDAEAADIRNNIRRLRAS